jgi:hypothetical protein
VPAVALSRAGARVVESGPGGEDLVPGAWQRLEALPDPRSPQGRIYPLPCLIVTRVFGWLALPGRGQASKDAGIWCCGSRERIRPGGIAGCAGNSPGPATT